jgi:small subunit ribosomal protein S17
MATKKATIKKNINTETKLAQETSDKQRAYREFVGIVKSTAMNKTITVSVASVKKHYKYPKSFTITKKYHVHDEKQAAKVGDSVRFVECRPLSATKRWRLVEVLKKANG